MFAVFGNGKLSFPLHYTTFPLKTQLKPIRFPLIFTYFFYENLEFSLYSCYNKSIHFIYGDFTVMKQNKSTKATEQKKPDEDKKTPASQTSGIADDFIQKLLENYFQKR